MQHSSCICYLFFLAFFVVPAFLEKTGWHPWFPPNQWRAEGGANGAPAPGHPSRGGRPNSEITKIKMLKLDDFSYCKSTDTCSMD